VTTPEQNGSVQGSRPVFSGTGDAGATIEYKGAKRIVAITAVQNNGGWTAESLVDLAKDEYTLTVLRTSVNGGLETTKVIFTVE